VFVCAVHTLKGSRPRQTDPPRDGTRRRNTGLTLAL
jgi:hypothetical protein